MRPAHRSFLVLPVRLSSAFVKQKRCRKNCKAQRHGEPGRHRVAVLSPPRPCEKENAGAQEREADGSVCGNARELAPSVSSRQIDEIPERGHRADRDDHGTQRTNCHRFPFPLRPQTGERDGGAGKQETARRGRGHPPRVGNLVHDVCSVDLLVDAVVDPGVVFIQCQTGQNRTRLPQRNRKPRIAYPKPVQSPAPESTRQRAVLNCMGGRSGRN